MPKIIFITFIVMQILFGCQRKYKFSKHLWQYQSDPAFPAEGRPQVIDDLLDNVE